VSQEALSNPGRKRRGTAPALRGARRRAGIDQRIDVLVNGRQWSIQRRRRATLMRHEVAEVAAERGSLERDGLLLRSLAAAPAPAA